MESFDLSGNDIRDPGIVEFCQLVHPDVREVNLEANHFGTTGCNALAGIICDETFENFQELHLGNNLLRNAGVELLAEGMVHNRSLVRLNLCRNHIRLGLHLDGLPFEAFTDSKCFLKIEDGDYEPKTPTKKTHKKSLSHSRQRTPPHSRHKTPPRRRLSDRKGSLKDDHFNLLGLGLEALSIPDTIGEEKSLFA